MSALLQSTLALLERPTAHAVARFEPPGPGEFAEYYGRYIRRVPEGDLAAHLRRQADQVLAAVGELTPAQADFAYAEGKWSVKEVLGHCADTERLFSYRATSIGRGDPTALPGMDQEVWMAGADFRTRPLAATLAEWIALRAATLALVEGFPAGASALRGTASGNPFSVRALLYVIHGHVDYHLEKLRQDYFASPNWPK